MKIFEGVVVALKMNNTAIVEITRRTPHPLYGKLIKRSKKYKVDVTGAEIAVGQTVKIVETRPISKDKYFKVMENKKPTAKVSIRVSSVKVSASVEPVAKATSAKKAVKTAKPAAAKAGKKGVK